MAGKIIAACVGLLIVALPFFLLIVIISVITFLNPSGEALNENVYYKAKEEIREEYSIENDLEIAYLQCLDLIAFNDLKTNQSAIKEYIKDNFIKKVTREVVIDDEIHSTTVTVFLDTDDLKVLMKQSPYNLSDKDIEFILSFALVHIDTPLLGKYPMPMEGSITSHYGKRINPVTGQGIQFHAGTDIRGKHHAKIASIADGIIQKVNLSISRRGNYVIIKHETEDGIFYSVSQHMSAIFVKEGDKVMQGQVIGLEGGEPGIDNNPGDTTGHHLHFEIWKTMSPNSHTNPADYILK